MASHNDAFVHSEHEFLDVSVGKPKPSPASTHDPLET